MFLGIFLTMVPALGFLKQHGASLGSNYAGQVAFWVTGAFSSFLDNAPTYVTLLRGRAGAGKSRAWW